MPLVLSLANSALDDLSENIETTPPPEFHDVIQYNNDIRDSDSSSDYDTALISSTKWYSASRGFLCYR
ncbi:hypothetical protein RclHR1_17600001 [Rhizophagus clarus]|uniref:Uncharacterized protein n=1 Tax=Rhizophagus clarus TaxID=94130 RepID=A0A2Z6RDL7_9GLOM|nr:hypothetical protein RclHR1_17600001 [Rhizophagus clarus]